MSSAPLCRPSNLSYLLRTHGSSQRATREPVFHCKGSVSDHSRLLALGHFPTVPLLSRVTPLAVAASISFIFLFRLVVFTSQKQYQSMAPKSRVTKNICLPSGNNVVAVVCLQYNHAFRNHNKATKRSHTGRKRETLLRRGRTQ